jgi:hypothetical protein
MRINIFPIVALLLSCASPPEAPLYRNCGLNALSVIMEQEGREHLFADTDSISMMELYNLSL